MGSFCLQRVQKTQWIRDQSLMENSMRFHELPTSSATYCMSTSIRYILQLRIKTILKTNVLLCFIEKSVQLLIMRMKHTL